HLSGAHRRLPSFPTRRSSDLAAHPGIEDTRSLSAAVIGQEHDQRIVGEAPFVELLEKRAEIVVDVLDHSEEAGHVVGDFAAITRSEEHTSELQSLTNLVCRLL